MSALLVFDTETTGLVDWTKALADPSQPRLVQLGAVLFDAQAREVASVCFLLRPDGWVSAGAARAVHAIPQRRSELYGVRARGALAVFMDMVRAAGEIAAYGLRFDEAVIDIELAVAGAHPLEWKRDGLRRTCVLQEAAQALSAGKSMKLPAAHSAATGEAFEPTHNGLDDARAAARVLFALRARRAAA